MIRNKEGDETSFRSSLIRDYPLPSLPSLFVVSLSCCESVCGDGISFIKKIGGQDCVTVLFRPEPCTMSKRKSPEKASRSGGVEDSFTTMLPDVLWRPYDLVTTEDRLSCAACSTGFVGVARSVLTCCLNCGRLLCDDCSLRCEDEHCVGNLCSDSIKCTATQLMACQECKESICPECATGCLQ